MHKKGLCLRLIFIEKRLPYYVNKDIIYCVTFYYDYAAEKKYERKKYIEKNREKWLTHEKLS